MVVPLPPTLLPPHPCLAEPPCEAVKSAIPYRTALRLLVYLQIPFVIAILISPAPRLAFSQCISIFMGIAACHSTMPLRYNLYGIITLYVCLSSTIRFADRVTLPEFGYSHTRRVIELAQLIDGVIDAEAGGFAKPHQPILDRSQSINPRELFEVLRTIQNRPRVVPVEEKSFLQSKLKGQQRQNVMSPDAPSLLETVGRVSPMSVETDIFSIRRNPEVEDFKSVTGYSFIDSPDKQRRVLFSPERLLEFVKFRPAKWRSRLEMIALGVISLLTGMTSVLAFICGRKIELQVNKSIAIAFGIDQEPSDTAEGITEPLISENPPEPYLNDPMGERASAYRPFTGEAVTLEGWMAQQPTEPIRRESENPISKELTRESDSAV